MEADAPIACLLSGGVDSSLVARAAMRHTTRLTTICMRMPDERYDESRHAAEAAKSIGSNHLTVDTEAHPAEDLVYLVQTLGHPFR